MQEKEDPWANLSEGVLLELKEKNATNKAVVSRIDRILASRAKDVKK